VRTRVWEAVVDGRTLVSTVPSSNVHFHDLIPSPATDMLPFSAYPAFNAQLLPPSSSYVSSVGHTVVQAVSRQVNRGVITHPLSVDGWPESPLHGLIVLVT
jgi:hypothetical protein